MCEAWGSILSLANKVSKEVGQGKRRRGRKREGGEREREGEEGVESRRETETQTYSMSPTGINKQVKSLFCLGELYIVSSTLYSDFD